MAKSLCSCYVRRTLAFEVSTAGLDAILESLALHIAELLRRRIPAVAIVIWWGRRRPVLHHGHLAGSHAFPEVSKSRIVAMPEAFPVFVARGPGHRWVAELLNGIHVRRTPGFEVSAAGLYAIMESLPLHIAELLRRRIPAPAIVILAIPWLRAVRRRPVLGNQQGWRPKGQNQRW